MNKIPKFVDDAWNNCDEIIDAMTSEGKKDLDIYENIEEKRSITRFGILLDMKNSKGDGFSVLITDTDDKDVFRKRILFSSEAIRENFPSLVEKTATPYCSQL